MHKHNSMTFSADFNTPKPPPKPNSSRNKTNDAHTWITEEGSRPDGVGVSSLHQAQVSPGWGHDYPYSDELDFDPFEAEDTLSSEGKANNAATWRSHNSDLSRPYANLSDGNAAPWNQWQLHAAPISTGEIPQIAQVGRQSLPKVSSPYSGDRRTLPLSNMSFEMQSRSSSLGGRPASTHRLRFVSPQGTTAEVDDDQADPEDDWAIQSFDTLDKRLSAQSYGEGGLTITPDTQQFAIDFSGLGQQNQSLPTSAPAFAYDRESASGGLSLEDDFSWAIEAFPPNIEFPNDVGTPAVSFDASGTVPISMLPANPEDIASSWPPPSKDGGLPHFPSGNLIQTQSDGQIINNNSARARGNTVSSTQPVPIPRRPENLVIRTKKRGPTRKSRSNSLSENRSPPIRKGGRVGKLAESKAPVVAQKRADNVVCIQCKLRRVACPRFSKDAICTWCQDHELACVQATFTDISDLDTLNCIFQTYCVHLTPDRTRRYFLRYTSTFDLPWMIETLKPYYQKFEVRVESFTGAVWKLNLEFGFSLLGQLSKVCRGRPYLLSEMIAGKRGLLNEWVKCVRPMEANLSIFDRYHKYANMPSRNFYSLAPLNDKQPDQSLDIEDFQDAQVIRAIVHICRVVLRALEISALRDLQQRLNDMTRGRKTTEEIEGLMCETAQSLGSLRWRQAWWEKVETGYNSLDFTHRTNALAERLYFWYFTAKKRLTEARQNNLPQRQKAIYADVGEIWDDFPTQESHEGFRMWMLKAHQIILDNQIAGTLPAFQDLSADSLHP